MTFFNDTFQPNALDPKGFKDFALHVMKGYFVDLDQPRHWTKVCRESGAGIPLVVLGREIEPRVSDLGGALTPGLLNKIVRTFLINGPAVSPECAFRSK